MNVHYYIGLDLGQRHDPTAIAVVERATPVLRGFDPAAYFHLNTTEPEACFGVRHLERIPLGTSYPDVVRAVKDLTRRPEVRDRSTLVVDGTGVGRPVMDMLRMADLPCELVEVSITAGASAHLTRGCWYVPRPDLISSIQVLVDNGRLGIARDLRETESLIEELMGLRIEGGRDRGFTDMAMALGLACWKARRE
ncbi:MAG: hypothetical protein JSU00_04065 [Acidobacteria bacterium]|nr:hypothetical protein [Acidobacteriota bacterium]